MKSYLVIYNLYRPNQDYPKIEEAIETQFQTSKRIMRATWVIKSRLDAGQIRSKLSQSIDSNDQIIIFELSGNAAWQGLEDETSQWVEDNL